MRRLDCCVQGQGEGSKPRVCYHQQTAIFPKTVCAQTVQMYCHLLFDFIPIHRMNLYPCTKEVVRAELENTVFRMLVFITCLLCCQMSNISMLLHGSDVALLLLDTKWSFYPFLCILLYLSMHTHIYLCIIVPTVPKLGSIQQSLQPSLCMYMCPDFVRKVSSEPLNLL